MQEILNLIDRDFAGLGRVYTATDGLYIFRSEQLSSSECSMYEPCFFITLRDEKQLKIGKESISSGCGNFFVVATSLPCFFSYF